MQPQGRKHDSLSRYRAIAPVAVVVALASAQPAHAQHSSEDLAKQLANPIAALISIPFQVNYDHDFGPNDTGKRWLTNVQPVVPISVSDDWNLISRTILPVVWQDNLVTGNGEQFGLGDTVQSAFLSPKKPGESGIIWGVGPVFLLPTATESTLGSKKWGVGPTAVALKQSGPWTVGALVNQIWSVAGDDDRADVSSAFLQPFVNYTTKSATTFFLNTETNYDWNAGQASVPINAGVNQLFTISNQRIQVGGGVRYWVDSPDSGPEGFGMRFNLVFLFPTGG